MVDRLSEQELAARSGVDPGLVRRVVDLGILLPREEGEVFAASDARRVRLAAACDRAGLPLDGIGEAVAEGRADRRAGPNEVLVSEDVRQGSGAGGVRFHDVGPVELKNVSRPVRLYRASRA